MTDTATYIHMAVTAITAITSVVLAYLKMRDDKTSKTAEKESVCQQDFRTLETKVAVLEERINNEITMLSKLDDKLDQIRDRL